MKLRGLAPLMILLGAYASTLASGCRPEASATRQESRSATLGLSEEPSCEQACAQAKRCGLEVKDCQAACTSDATQGLQRCAMLQECRAFVACQAQAGPGQARSAMSVQQDCQSQCLALMQCRSTRQCEAQRFAALAVPGCEPTDSPDNLRECELECRKSERPCQPRASCEALEACAESQRQTSTGPRLAAIAEPRAALQADPNCHALCDRALSCGIEASGATAQEQDRLKDSLPAALLDSQTECLMQCQEEYRSERRADFEACLNQSSCDDFIECANDL